MTAARLAALEAIDAIRELPGRYADAYARLDLDALVELYVPDVALQDGRRGRAALRAHFERGIRAGAGLHTVILHCGDHIIELDAADEAHGTVYCHVEVGLGDGTGYQQAVLYTDAYRHVDGRWCFARQRRHELFYGAPALTRPNGLPDANWPASQVGRGTVPARWPSWQAYWRPS